MSDRDFIALTREQSARLIALTSQVEPYRLPLLRAMADGLLTLCMIPRGTPSPRKLEKIPGPIVCIVGDDDHQSTGPAGFPGARRLGYWERGVMVHAAGGETRHYELVALRAGRMLVVETDSAHADEWRLFLGDGKLGPVLMITPSNGCHPVMPGWRQ